MNAFTGALIFPTVFLVGCGATRDVAVTSYHVTRGIAVGSYRVATAPVHYALRKRGEGSEAVTTETIPSDVASPSQSIPISEAAVRQQARQQPSEERIPSSSRRVAQGRQR